MHNGNWFAVSRMVFDHYVVGAGQPVKPADPKRGAYSRLEAWLWLIANAAYEPSTIINRGRETDLQPGQLMGAYAYLSEVWNWTPETTRYFLKRLELTLMITRWCDKQKTTKNHNQCQIINVCNYERYQVPNQPQPQATQQPNSQAPAQASNKRAPSEQQESNNKHLEREREAPAGADASSVRVNGVAIYGPNFQLDFKAIDMAAGLVGVDTQRARQIAEICALDWAANKTRPHNPMAMVRAAIAADKNHGQIQDARLSKVTAQDGRKQSSSTTARFRQHFEEVVEAQQQQRPHHDTN